MTMIIHYLVVGIDKYPMRPVLGDTNLFVQCSRSLEPWHVTFKPAPQPVPQAEPESLPMQRAVLITDRPGVLSLLDEATRQPLGGLTVTIGGDLQAAIDKLWQLAQAARIDIENILWDDKTGWAIDPIDERDRWFEEHGQLVSHRN